MISTKAFYEKVELYLKQDHPNYEVISVWYCKTIQNHKGLFIIKDNRFGHILPNFYECTYNGDKNELYIDCYQKQSKTTIKIP